MHSMFKSILVICPYIVTVFIYMNRINFILIKYKIYVFYLLGGCECEVINQGSNAHLYIISTYFFI
jgi:hypothetical protein